MFRHPVTDRRFVQTNPSPDLRERQSLRKELFENTTIHARHSRGAFVTNGLQKATIQRRFRVNFVSRV
jgi:hypothetical protein